MFRVVVQDSRYTPTSGKVVASLGNYDPHAKTVTLDKEKAAFYLGNGAQPSVRAARLLQKEGVKLPAWVKLPADKERPVRNAEKRRSTRPDEPAEAEAPAAETETPVETPAEAPAAEAETPAEDAEAPVEESAEESESATEAESTEPAEVAVDPAESEAAEEEA